MIGALRWHDGWGGWTDSTDLNDYWHMVTDGSPDFMAALCVDIPVDMSAFCGALFLVHTNVEPGVPIYGDTQMGYSHGDFSSNGGPG